MMGMARPFTHAELKAIAKYLAVLPGELKTVRQTPFRSTAGPPSIPAERPCERDDRYGPGFDAEGRLALLFTSGEGGIRMGLLDALKLPQPRGVASAAPPVSGASTVDGKTARQDPVAHQKMAGHLPALKARLDSAWSDAVELGRRLQDEASKRKLAATMNEVDAKRREAGKAQGDPAAQVVLLGKALIALDKARAAAAAPSNGAASSAPPCRQRPPLHRRPPPRRKKQTISLPPPTASTRPPTTRTRRCSHSRPS